MFVLTSALFTLSIGFSATFGLVSMVVSNSVRPNSSSSSADYPKVNIFVTIATRYEAIPVVFEQDLL